MTVAQPSQDQPLELDTEQPITSRTWPIPGCTPALHASVTAVGPAEVSEGCEAIPVVFLHGLVGLNEHWEPVVERVCDQLRCVLFQLPLLQLRGDFCSIQGVQDITARYLRDQIRQPAIIVGNSFGGHIAARLAIHEPALVRGLVLTGASGLIEKSLVSDIQLRPSRQWLSRKIGELFYDSTLMREADLDRAHKELSERGNARAMVRLSRSARKDHLGRYLSQIQAPSLLIWGKDDIVTPPEAAKQYEQQIPVSRMVWFDRCGHVPMMEYPVQFASELLGFAASLHDRA